MIAKVQKVETDLGTHYVRRMSWSDLFAYTGYASALKKKKKLSQAEDHEAAYLYLLYCVCDENGKRLYADDQIEEVKGIDGDVAFALYGEAVKINSRAKEIDDAKKG